MKKTVIAACSSLALLVAFPACDSHSWEDSEDGKVPGTKRLFQPHGEHGGDGHAEKHEGESKEEGK